MYKNDHPLFFPLWTLIDIGDANSVTKIGDKHVVRFHDDSNQEKSCEVRYAVFTLKSCLGFGTPFMAVIVHICMPRNNDAPNDAEYDAETKMQVVLQFYVTLKLNGKECTDLGEILDTLVRIQRM